MNGPWRFLTSGGLALRAFIASQRGRTTARQALLLAVVVGFAATMALWSAPRGPEPAKADIANTTVTVTDNVGSSVDPGTVVTYTIIVAQTGVVGGDTDNTHFRMFLDPDGGSGTNVGAVTFPAANDSDATPWVAAECSASIGISTQVDCNDTAGPINSDVITVNVTVIPGDNNLLTSPASAGCQVYDDGDGSENCTFSNVSNPVSINGVTVDPNSATNLIGTQHTITWTLPSNMT